MSRETIRAALEAATDTKHFRIGSGVLNQAAEIFVAGFGRKPVLLVADENTWKAAGETARDVLSRGGLQLDEPMIFPGDPVLPPDYSYIEEVRDRLASVDSIAVAVGSGTLNDIVKRASSEVGRPYMNITTAASVDGFTAFGAAILKDAFKQTLTCPAPMAVLADVDVLRNAPAEMTASGYADLVSEITAGADWIIADLLGIEPIHRVSWDLVQKRLRDWISRPAELRAGDPAAFEDLFEGLSMNGFAMQAMQSSRPASGTEHLFSHVWEMEHLAVQGRHVSHGFKVALGTLAATALMEVLLARDAAALDVDRRCATWISWADREKEARAEFGTTPIINNVLQACKTKYVDADVLRERLERLQRVWPDVQRRVSAQLIPYGDLVTRFEAAGVPVSPKQVGLARSHIRSTFARANMIRTRYTSLDLAYETGCWDDCLEEIFSNQDYLAD